MASPRSLSLCRLGALLYVAVQAVVSAAAFATTFARRYGDGSVDRRDAFLPLTIALNIAQAVALLALALPAAWFDRLRTPPRWRTGVKVAWVLTVIFGAYWQEMIIYALLRWNVVGTADSWTLRSSSFARVAHTMHAWILCVELFFAAALFGVAFAPNAEEAEGSESGGKVAAPTREGVGFAQGLAGALGLGSGEAPPLLPPPPTPPPAADSELGSVSAYDSDAEARAQQEAEEVAAAKAERRRRRERSDRLSAGPSGRSALSSAFSDSARLDTLEEAPPAEEPAEPAEPEPEVAPSAEPEPMLHPPRTRRRAPLPYALSAMPVVLAPPERDVAGDGRPSACNSGVYSSILGWMGMGQPSHPYDGAPPPVALPPPGLPLRVAAPSRGAAAVRDVETGAADGEAAPPRDRPYWERAQERAMRPRQSTSRPASETLEQLVAKLGMQVKGTWRPEGY